MNRKAFAYASLLIIGALLLAACAAPPAEQVEVEATAVPAAPTEAPEPTAAPPEPADQQAEFTEPEGSELANTLVAAHSEYAFTYDPTFCSWGDVCRICMVAYDPLLKYDPASKQVVPWLAKEWDVSDDGLTYTFTLNEGITFHDGTEMTASDVKFTIERLLGIDDGCARYVYPVESMEVADDYTIAVTLDAPNAAFLQSMVVIFIISEDGVKANEVDGDWAQAYLMDNDLGSGPYQHVSTVPEQQAVFEKFEGYWKGWDGDHVDGITWLWIKESATQRLMLESGELDISMEPSVDDLAEFEASPDYQVLEGESPVIFEVDFRVIHPPLDDIRVRQALAMAIDYDYHIEVALAGYGRRAQGPLTSVFPYHNYDIELIPFDLEAAKALLAEAGYPEGGFTLKVAYESAQEEKIRALEMVQANWGELGIEIEPMGMDWMAQAAMQQDVNSEPDVYLGYIWPGMTDPECLREFYHGDQMGVFDSNASFWSDPEVDRLMDEGLMETDPARREEIYKQVQQLIADAIPAAWVSENPYNMVANKYVKGYVYNSAYHQALDVYHMWLEGKP